MACGIISPSIADLINKSIISGYFPSHLNPFMPMEHPTVINWIRPFPFQGLLGSILYFIKILKLLKLVVPDAYL